MIIIQDILSIVSSLIAVCVFLVPEDKLTGTKKVIAIVLFVLIAILLQYPSKVSESLVSSSIPDTSSSETEIQTSSILLNESETSQYTSTENLIFVETNPLNENIATLPNDVSSKNTTEKTKDLFKISTNEQDLLSQLLLAFKNNDKTSAANLLYKNQKLVENMLSNTFDNKLVIFNGENTSSTIEGEGIVIKSIDCAFYGNFKTGMPEGHCMGVYVNREDCEVDILDYNFIDANWKNGKANGEGKTGWVYTEYVYETELFEGNFVEDLFCGMVKWTIESIDNENDEYFIDSTEIIYDENGKLDLSKWRQDVADPSIYYDSTGKWSVHINSWISNGCNYCPWL